MILLRLVRPVTFHFYCKRRMFLAADDLTRVIDRGRLLFYILLQPIRLLELMAFIGIKLQ